MSSILSLATSFEAPPDKIIESAALLSGSSPSIALLCKSMYTEEYIVDDDDAFVVRESSAKVYIADLESESFNMYEDMKACPL